MEGKFDLICFLLQIFKKALSQKQLFEKAFIERERERDKERLGKPKICGTWDG